MRRQGSRVDERIDSAFLDDCAVDAKESVHAAYKSKREYIGVECWQHGDCRLWTVPVMFSVEWRAVVSLK